MIPELQRVDHFHVMVSDRDAAEAWYKQVLGFERIEKFVDWADAGGPLTLANKSDTIHIALFQRPVIKHHAVIAFLVGAKEFIQWQNHLNQLLDKEIDAVDHDLSWSLYFTDPDGNPYEITNYDYSELQDQIKH